MKKRKSSIARNIWRLYNGVIPKDEDGRSYEIHHIDGNSSNNDIDNLKAITIQEHYDIHKSQGDFSSCLFISVRMKLSSEERSNIARMSALKRVVNGTHHFLGAKLNNERIANGTNPFVGPKMNKERIANETHNFLGPRMNKERWENGTHNFQKLYKCDCGCGKSYNSGNLSQHKRKNQKINDSLNKGPVVQR